MNPEIEEQEKEYTRNELTLFECIVSSPEEATQRLSSLQAQGRKVVKFDCASVKELLALGPQLALVTGQDILINFTMPGSYLSWDLVENVMPDVLDSTLYRFCPEDLRVYIVRMGKSVDYNLPENSSVWPPA